jgi:RNA polymerase sigma factor (sigma-70 family)
MLDKHKDEDSELPQLLRACKQHQSSAQYRVYALFYHYAMSIAQRYVGTYETAEEVVNDAFFKVFTKIDRYEESQPFRFWLRRIVVNTAIDRLRGALNQQKFEPLPEQCDTEEESGIIQELTREQILDKLHRLPPAYRTVFNLFVVDGYTHEEIAQLLGISPGSSKSNLSRARQHLRALFSDDFEFKK